MIFKDDTPQQKADKQMRIDLLAGKVVEALRDTPQWRTLARICEMNPAATFGRKSVDDLTDNKAKS